MKWVKRAAVWLAGMLVIVLLCNTAGCILDKVFGMDILMPAMCG